MSISIRHTRSPNRDQLYQKRCHSSHLRTFIDRVWFTWRVVAREMAYVQWFFVCTCVRSTKTETKWKIYVFRNNNFPFKQVNSESSIAYTAQAWIAAHHHRCFYGQHIVTRQAMNTSLRPCLNETKRNSEAIGLCGGHKSTFSIITMKTACMSNIVIVSVCRRRLRTTEQEHHAVYQSCTNCISFAIV